MGELMSLPNELLDKVISYLPVDRSLLLILSRLCWRLNKHTQKYLFRYADDLSQRQQDLFKRALQQNPALAPLVQAYGPVAEDHNGYVAEDDYAAVESFTKLRKLRLQVSGHLEQWLPIPSENMRRVEEAETMKRVEELEVIGYLPPGPLGGFRLLPPIFGRIVLFSPPSQELQRRIWNERETDEEYIIGCWKVPEISEKRLKQEGVGLQVEKITAYRGGRPAYNVVNIKEGTVRVRAEVM